MDSRYEKPLPLTWTSEYIYQATVLEILHILSVENDYGIELTTEDFDNFNLYANATFATASQLQEILFQKAIQHTIIRVTGSEQQRHSTFTRVTLINKYIKALRKCIPDVEVDQFTPKQRRLYVFYGQGQSRPVHHTHMAQLVIINYYIRHCRQHNRPVGDKSEFQEFMMEFFHAPPYRPSSAPPLTVFTLNTHLIAEARRRGAETPEHEEYCKQFRDHRIALALERHNDRYLKNQRKSPVATRISNSFYIYSEPATPDEVPGKQKGTTEATTPDSVPIQRKKARLSGRLPGTSVNQPKQQFKTSQRRHRRKKNRFDLLYERTVEDTMKGKPIAWTTPSDVSSVDTEGQDNNTRTRSAPREPVSSSTTIPVAVPITQDDDPITTPSSRRRSARIEAQYAAQNPTESLTRSQSERRWRIFTRGLTRSEEVQAWRDYVRQNVSQFYADQEAKLKMAEEAKSKKQ
jgi:hypothetical protein